MTKSAHHFLAHIDSATAYCAASRLPDRQEVAQVLLSLQGLGVPLDPAPATWGELFDGLVDLATEVPVVLALDEVPYLVEGNPAWPACGGYPLLLQRWDAGVDAEANLTRLASDPFAPLVANASTLLLDITDTVGLRRTLIAVGRGASRRQEIDSRSGQRADRTLSTLVAAGFVRETMPLGETTARLRRFSLDDGYLRFWFSVIERDLPLIDAGQGAPALRRALRRSWPRLLGSTFEDLARHHAARLVRQRELPEDLVVGKWWADRPLQVELDVVGMVGSRWHLVGEAKWAARFGRSDWTRFQRSLEAAGDRSRDAHLALWCRGGVAPEILAQRPDLSVFTPAGMVV